MIAVRRRKASRRRPDRGMSLPQSVKIVLPPKHKVDWVRVGLALLPVAVVLAGGWFAYKKFSAPPVEEEAPPELQEVTIEAPPPPEPEPEPEADPEPEAEPESELPDLLSGNEGDLGPSTDISLDLALGTGAGGMAIGTGPAKSGAGSASAKSAYDAGQVEKLSLKVSCPDPEPPKQALEKGLAGKFVAVYVVNARGRVENIRVTGSPAGIGYEESIRKALGRCRFEPAVAGGVPVPDQRSDDFDFGAE
jgi:outer membrane biosynthesis protein TonB